VEYLEDFVDLVGTIANLKEWGIIAFLLLLLLYDMITSRKDRNKAREVELQREEYVAQLLEHRHDKYENVFEKSTTVLAETKIALNELSNRVEDVEDKVTAVDSKCTERQKKWIKQRYHDDGEEI